MRIRVPGFLALAFVLVVGAVAAGPAEAAEGDLAFTSCLGSLLGCPGLNPEGLLFGAASAAVSGDGKQLYVSAYFANAVSHFTLDANAVPTFSDCVGSPTGCVTAGGAPDGVGRPRDLALSRDGTHLYAAAYFNNGFSWYTLDGAGALTFAGCVGDKGPCTLPAFSGQMKAAEGVALSPDGKQLYVAAGTENLDAGTVSHFTIGAGGAPTFVNCVGTVVGCTPTTAAAKALVGARGLAVSEDGKNLYVAADGNATFQRGGVSRFTLDAGGSPTFAGCVGDAVGCATASIPGAMAYPSALVISRDGGHLYAGTNSAVADLSLDAAGGMSFRDCVGSISGCASAGSPGVLSAVWGLVPSVDGKRLYATSYGTDNVSWLPLDAGGAPTFGGCIGVSASCTQTTPAGALNGAINLAPTPDGRHLFVTVYDSKLLDSFAIEQAPPVAPGVVPSPGPGPGPAPAPDDTTTPALTRFKLSRSTFAAAPKGGSVAARKRARIKRGTTVGFTLSEPATVTFTVERRTAGRKVKRHCVAVRKRNRDRPSCKRYVTAKGSFKVAGKGGPNSIGFTGRLRGHKLAPGSYRLVARARDAAGNPSRTQRVAFTIVAG